MSRMLKIFLIVIIFLVSGYFHIFHPYMVVGQPISPFIKGQTVLASKLFFYFNEPKVGDRVIFYPNQGNMEYIGLIVSLDNSDDVLTYTVDSAKGKSIWLLSRDKISSYIWYPLKSY